MSTNKIVELTHVLTTHAGERKTVRTPFISDMSQIITIKLEQTSNRVDTLSIYPNGFICRNIVESGTSPKTVIMTNYPLIDQGSGIFDIDLPN